MVLAVLQASCREGERHPEADDCDEVYPRPAVPQVRQVAMGLARRLFDAQSKWQRDRVARVVGPECFRKECGLGGITHV